jgi:hypothetical protein
LADHEVQSRFVRSNRDPRDERPNELLPFFQTAGFQQARQFAQGRQATSKDGVGVDRHVRGALQFLAPVLEFAPLTT